MKWNHAKALSIKTPLVAIVFLLVLTAGFEVNWYNALWISLVITVVSYFLGDYTILPRFGNKIATVADFGLVFLMTWLLLETLLVGTLNDDHTGSLVVASLITAVIISICEYVFHKWLLHQQDHGDHRSKAHQR